MEFIEMNDNNNDKVISALEHGLSNYSVLTIGDTIQVVQGSTLHLLNVLSCTPSEAVKVVSDGPYLDLKIGKKIRAIVEIEILKLNYLKVKFL